MLGSWFSFCVGEATEMRLFPLFCMELSDSETNGWEGLLFNPCAVFERSEHVSWSLH